MSTDGTSAAAGLRVLIVDDDVVVPMMIAMGLDAVEVIEASRASEALHLAGEVLPDAIVVDRQLPDGDGLELVRALRSERSTETVPIVLVTAGYDAGLLSTVLRSGADEFVGKPVDPASLESTLRALLELGPDERRQRRESLARSSPLRAPGGPDAVPQLRATGPLPDAPS